MKAKDTPWDAVLMGSVVCTVDSKVIKFDGNSTNAFVISEKPETRRKSANHFSVLLV
jgi:hypothetical protein